jgi:hypothetical protein
VAIIRHHRNIHHATTHVIVARETTPDLALLEISHDLVPQETSRDQDHRKISAHVCLTWSAFSRYTAQISQTVILHLTATTRPRVEPWLILKPIPQCRDDGCQLIVVASSQCTRGDQIHLHNQKAWPSQLRVVPLVRHNQ